MIILHTNVLVNVVFKREYISLFFHKDNIVKISTGLDFIFMEWETGKNVKKSFKQFWPLEINCEFKTH